MAASIVQSLVASDMIQYPHDSKRTSAYRRSRRALAVGFDPGRSRIDERLRHTARDAHKLRQDQNAYLWDDQWHPDIVAQNGRHGADEMEPDNEADHQDVSEDAAEQMKSHCRLLRHARRLGAIHHYARGHQAQLHLDVADAPTHEDRSPPDHHPANRD